MDGEKLKARAEAIVDSLPPLGRKPTREDFIDAMVFAATIGQTAMANHRKRLLSGREEHPINTGVFKSTGEFVAWCAILLAGLEEAGEFSPPKQFGDRDKG